MRVVITCYIHVFCCFIWKRPGMFYPTRKPFLLLCLQSSCLSVLLRLEWQSFPFWHFTLTLRTQQAAECWNKLFFPFLHWCLCPSAPVLKINHHTVRRAPDFHMSNKENERCKGLIHCHATFRETYSINAALLSDRRTGCICIHLCLLFCDVTVRGHGW